MCQQHSGVAPLDTQERIRQRHLEMERVQMMIGCKLTLSRGVREGAKIKTNTREDIARPTQALQTSTRARIVANRVEERMTTPPAEILAKAREKTQVKGKANIWTLSKPNNFSLLKQLQPCRILRKIRVVGELSCISMWIIGVTLDSVSSTRREAGAEHLLLDSGAQLHACPLTYPGQRYRYLILESTQQVEQDYNTTEDDWSNFQKDEQSEYFSMRVQCRNQFCLLAVSLSRCTGVICVQTVEHCSFLTKTRRNSATHSCTRKRGCSLSKRRWLRPGRQLE